MRSITSISLFLVLTFTSLAQERKFEFGAHLFPNYSTGLIHSVSDSSEWIADNARKLETWKPSISAGLNVGYRIGERVRIDLGINYQNTGERIKSFPLVLLTPSGIDTTSTAKLYYNHHNLEIPVHFSYYAVKDIFYIRIGGSCTFNLANINVSYTRLTGASSWDRSSGKDVYTQYRKVNIFTNLGVGVDLIRKQRITCYMEPYAQYGILGLTHNSSVNRYTLSVGLGMGIRIK